MSNTAPVLNEQFRRQPADQRGDLAHLNESAHRDLAAHSSDRVAAAAAGLRTAFITRPEEHGPGIGIGIGETVARVPVDVSSTGPMDLADRLGCR